MKNLKKFLFRTCLCLIVALLGIVILSYPLASAFAENKPNTQEITKLSQLSETECLEFLYKEGVAIPNEVASSPELFSFINKVLIAVELNPRCVFPYNYDVILKFAEDIRNIANAYYGIQTNNILKRSSNYELTYSLQDSTLYGPYSGWLSYNCYAYAIDRCENPPQYNTDRQYQPGDFSGLNFDLSLTIYQMSLVVKSDLEELDYCNVTVSNFMPSIQEGQKLICIRRGNFDYHFMKYNAGYWYHKPGFTAVLKYNYQPTTNRVWITEYVDSNGVANLANGTYDSDIYYITYQSHDFDDNVWVPYTENLHRSFCMLSGCNGFIVQSHDFDIKIGNRWACSACRYIQNGSIIGPLSLSFPTYSEED